MSDVEHEVVPLNRLLEIMCCLFWPPASAWTYEELKLSSWRWEVYKFRASPGHTLHSFILYSPQSFEYRIIYLYFKHIVLLYHLTTMKYKSASIQTLSCLAAWHAASASATCHDYVLIDSRGTGELQGESIGFRSMIAQVMDALPNGARHDTVYPAGPDLTQITTFIGSTDIETLIQHGLTDCPSQKYALLGYSQGATVTNQVLQKFTPFSAEGQAIKAVVLVGNPYHVPNQQGNKDEKCGTSTAGANGVLNPIADFRIPASWYQTGKVLDICYTNDAVCNGINIGDLFSPTHLVYGFDKGVQSCGAHFLVMQLA